MTLRGRAVLVALVAALGFGGTSALEPVPVALGAVASPTCRTWKVVPTPALVGYYLSSVSGTSSSDVWAVGDDYAGLPPLALHWGGSAWTQFPVTDTGILQDVADISPTDAWAVGAGGYSVAVQHWDGTAWSPVKAPSPGYNYVNGVDAPSSDDVWMVGSYTRSDLTVQPLAEHWDGTAWKIIQAEPLIDGGVLYKVSGVSSDDVWAVGYQGTPNEFKPLIEHWDGAAWTVVPAPPPPSGTNDQLYGIDAGSSSDVWAVGFYADPNLAQPLIEHWDGANWTLASVPPLEGGDDLFDVAAISFSDVWAVGESFPAQSADYRPLTMHWDGATWTAYWAPPRATNGSLVGVWAPSSQQVLAVGADTPQDIEPLVDRSRGVCR